MPSERPLSPRDRVAIIKTGFKRDGRDGRGCWAACREAACQMINETLPKVLGRQPFVCEIQKFHILEMTTLSTSIDYPLLKDRILRLWNLTVSSIRATITTQFPRGEGRVRGNRIDLWRYFVYHHPEDFGKSF